MFNIIHDNKLYEFEFITGRDHIRIDLRITYCLPARVLEPTYFDSSLNMEYSNEYIRDVYMKDYPDIVSNYI